MSVDKFGRNKKTSTPGQGISLSYLEKHFQRKTDITRKLADLENDVNKLEKRYIQYVEKVQRDQGKQYITIWTEENGSLAKDTYEYSFGDGMVGKWAGYTVLTPSKVLKMGISVSSRVDPVDVGVSLVVNGVKTKCSILKPLGKYFLFPLVELSKIKARLVLRLGQRVNKIHDGGKYKLPRFAMPCFVPNFAVKGYSTFQQEER